ncbi:MAG TPA: molybdate ABC transporter substrate-binding protein [Polyangiales bacterium]|nr:molybdate ABC transporter substrate-binding protein [Polyangiales bacterium]
MRRLALLLLLVGCEKAVEPKLAPVRVAAASDLTRAFEDVRVAFEAASKQPVVLTFGASGMLQKQLASGAPFDVFASANASFVDALVTSKDCLAETRAPYALGHLVLWSKPGLVAPAQTLAELTDPRFKRIAIGNPESAPYGKAAKEALTRAGLWEQLQPRLVVGENIKQTMQYAESGNAEAALVALSLVVDAPPYLRVDEAMHAPIDQTLVVCTHGDNAEGGKAFAQFVNSEPGRAIMRRYGLLLPGESLASSK